MKVSHHVSSNSIIYRKRAIHRTKTERPFLAAKAFKANNLVQFLPPYHVIISNVHVGDLLRAVVIISVKIKISSY